MQYSASQRPNKERRGHELAAFSKQLNATSINYPNSFSSFSFDFDFTSTHARDPASDCSILHKRRAAPAGSGRSGLENRTPADQPHNELQRPGHQRAAAGAPHPGWRAGAQPLLRRVGQRLRGAVHLAVEVGRRDFATQRQVGSGRQQGRGPAGGHVEQSIVREGAPAVGARAGRGLQQRAGRGAVRGAAGQRRAGQAGARRPAQR